MKQPTKNILSAAFIVAGLVGFTTPVWSHAITEAGEGDIETNNAYVGNDGKVIKTGIGECLRSSGWSADDAAAACEGGEAEQPAPEPEPEAKKPEPPKQVATVETITVDGMGLFATDSAELTSEGMARDRKSVV